MRGMRYSVARGTQFDPVVVEAFLAMPATLWTELRENIRKPYRLSQLRAI